MTARRREEDVAKDAGLEALLQRVKARTVTRWKGSGYSSSLPRRRRRRGAVASESSRNDKEAERSHRDNDKGRVSTTDVGKKDRGGGSPCDDRVNTFRRKSRFYDGDAATRHGHLMHRSTSARSTGTGLLSSKPKTVVAMGSAALSLLVP